MSKHRADKTVTTPRSGSTVPNVVFALFMLAVVGIIIFWYSSSGDREENARPDPTKPKVKIEQWQVLTEEDRVCDQFMKMHNAHEAGANNLLGQTPVVPTDPITEAESDTLSTEFFLRAENLHIERCRAKTAANGDHYYVFRTKGNVVSPPIRTLRADGSEMGPPVPQRLMLHPDLLVKVRDGKIFAIGATLQRD